MYKLTQSRSLLLDACGPEDGSSLPKEMTNTVGQQGWHGRIGSRFRATGAWVNCRPAVGSESCGPVIIVFEGREDAPLLAQAPDTAQTVPGRRSGGPLARFTAAP